MVSGFQSGSAPPARRYGLQGVLPLRSGLRCGRWFVFGLLLHILLSVSALYGQIYNRSYAVLIGIDNYPSLWWQDLAYARNDAYGTAQFLSRHGFDEIITLYDEHATKATILSALGTYLPSRIREGDCVFFFFAGHTHHEEVDGHTEAYLVPFDGEGRKKNLISFDELNRIARKMGPYTHQLFVIDGLFEPDSGLPEVIPETIPEVTLTGLTRESTRQWISGGSRNQVFLDNGPKGHSVFGWSLLRALEGEEAEKSGDGFIGLPEIIQFVRGSTDPSFQTPLTGTFNGHGKGQFLFVTAEKGAQLLAQRPAAGTEPAPLPPPPVDPSDSSYFITYQDLARTGGEKGVEPSRAILNAEAVVEKEGLDFQVIADGPIREFKTFFIDATNSLVVDLPGHWRVWRNLPKRFPAENELVKEIRVLLRADEFRVLFHLTAGVQPEPQIEPTASGLSIIVGKPPAKKARALAASAAKPAPDGTRRLFSLEPETGRGLMILQVKADGPVQNFKYFKLPTGNRLVIDLPGKWALSKEVKARYKLNHSLVKQVRHGTHPSYFRIVYDMNTEEAIEPLIKPTLEGLSITLESRR